MLAAGRAAFADALGADGVRALAADGGVDHFKGLCQFRRLHPVAGWVFREPFEYSPCPGDLRGSVAKRDAGLKDPLERFRDRLFVRVEHSEDLAVGGGHAFFHKVFELLCLLFFAGFTHLTANVEHFSCFVGRRL